MPFLTSIAQWLRGSSGYDVTAQALAQASNTAISLGPFWPSNPRAGYVRIKQASQIANVQAKIGWITMTDGTNVANIYRGDRYLSQPGEYVDRAIPFNLHWEVTNINLNVWTLNADPQWDVEVVGMRL